VNRYIDITSRASCAILDGAVYYVTPTGGVFLELRARQGAPYVRRCNERLTARVIAASKHKGCTT